MGRNLGKRCRKILAILLALLFIIGNQAVYAADPLTNHLTNWPKMSDVSVDSACLIDPDNKAILYSLDRDTERYPASTTKIMTCLLTLENASLSDTVTIGEEAMEVAISGNSNSNPVLGEKFTVEQCLYMLMLKSANDIAVALAVHVGGSVSGFARMMNDRAREIGCTGTHFTNPSGLPDPEHVTTAYDLALIMGECIRNPMFRTLVKTQRYTVPPTNKTPESRTYDNHNALIMEGGAYYYEECIGGKTGYTDAAQRTLVAAAERNGRTLVGVTMHGATDRDFADMKALFEYGFTSFSRLDLTMDAEGYAASGSVTIPDGIAVDSLSGKAVTDTDGETITEYSYEGLPVGYAVRIREEVSSEESVEPVSEASEKKTGKGVRLLRRFFLILAVVCLAAVVLLTLIRRHLIRKRRRRRRRRKRRR